MEDKKKPRKKPKRKIVSTSAGTGDCGCPYFVAHGKTEIHCEGYFGGSKCVQRFRSGAIKDRIFKRYCCGDWERCAQHIMIDRKYEQIERLRVESERRKLADQVRGSARNDDG